MTYPVGEITPKARKLIKAAEETFYKGMEQMKPGKRISDISFAIQSHVESQGFSIIRAFVGHGIGLSLHEEPQVPNFGPPGRGPMLKSGMVLAIEPMVNIGTSDVKVLKDGWTVVTADKTDSAHFEHSVAITKDGPYVLSKI